MSARHGKAAEGPSANVVRLPTAARRKPENHRYAAQCGAARAVKAQTAHRFGYLRPGVRAAMKDAEAFHSTALDPALLIVVAMFKHLPDEAQRDVMRIFDLQGSRGSVAYDQAKVAMKLCRPVPTSESVAFWQALDVVAARDGQHADQPEDGL